MGVSVSSFQPKSDLVDLKGRVAIVTGANSGIGLYTLLHLVRCGAKVHLAARSEEKAMAAIERVKAEGLGETPGDIVWLKFDLSDPRKAKASAESFLNKEDRLDILVNNAAKLMSSYGQTADGFSDSMVINHISPFLFTNTLLPLMRRTASQPGSDVRIVNVCRMNATLYDSLQAMNADFTDTMKPQLNLYSYTKLANILWTKELQRRFDSENTAILAMAVHPGNVMSEGNVKIFNSWPWGSFVHRMFSLFFISSHDGGYTPAWAAASKEIENHRDKFKGGYIVPYGSLEVPSPDAIREDLSSELWTTTEKVLEEYKWV
ncbi:NAD-P-binding protein [Amylostereum chailletii]|nr:NAD-P-binding protein [Amylostereum chailletii]